MDNINTYKQIFKEKEWQIQFEKEGYIILDGIPKEVLKALRNESKKLLANIKNEHPEGYFSAGQLARFELRNQSTQIIKTGLLPYILQHFDAQKIDIYSGNHLIKPRGKGSFLNTHQDSSLVDEVQNNAILAWCPLQDVNILNGRLCVLPGSHLIGNHYRSTTIKWVFEPFKKLIYKHSIPLIVKAGQICYFHTALIHHSQYNFFTPYRIALSAFITDKDATLINCFSNEETAKGKVEIYETDMDFFHNYDFNKRPPVQYKKLKEVEVCLPNLTHQKMKEMLNNKVKN